MCLKELRRRSQEEYDGDDEAACNALQPWFTEKTNSPCSCLCSLQHRASLIAFQMMSMPQILWTDRKRWTELLYKGNKICLEELQGMFAAQEESIVMQWESKILCGISICTCYSNLADDLSNHAVGYSFLTDKRNNCFQDRDALTTAFAKNVDVMKWFGVMRDGRMIWNREGLMNWLDEYAEFQGQLLLWCEMLSRAPGRGMELMPMTFCNTKHHSQCNLVIMGKHVALLQLYHKLGAMTGQDKLIPHALDAVMGDLMVQSLPLACPFAELAAHVCYPDQSDIKKLYQTQLFVNKDRPFTMDNISLSMSRLSLPHVSFKIMVNPWRHISIAFKRKLGQFAKELLELDKNNTVDALQAGHTRATENQVYSLSPDAMGGAAEDLLPLFLEVSKQWQKILHTVPGGLGLPYSKARTSEFRHLVRPERSEEIPKDDIMNAVLVKLEEKMRGLEDGLAKKLVNALMPAIHEAVQSTIKTV